MKRIYLSSFLIFTFAAYTLYGRILNSSAPTMNGVAYIVKPTSPQINIQNENIGYEVVPIKPVPTPIIVAKQEVAPTPVQMPTGMMQTPNQMGVDMGLYRNGKYTGDVVDAGYGYVQVVAIISMGEISDVQFLDYPQDRQESLRKNLRAIPILIKEAITIQDSNVDTVSGASFTSQAYRESLASALSQARI